MKKRLPTRNGPISRVLRQERQRYYSAELRWWGEVAWFVLDRLKRERRLLDSELGHMLGCHHTTIQNWRRRGSVPPTRAEPILRSLWTLTLS